MKQILILSILALLLAAVRTDSIAILATDAASNITFTETTLNLSKLDTQSEGDIAVGLALVNASDLLPADASLSAAVARTYSDGHQEYSLFLDSVDAQGNIHEYEAVVSDEANNTLYNLVGINQVNGSSSTPIAYLPVSIDSLANSTTLGDYITILAKSLAANFKLLTQEQIASDANIPSLERGVAQDYPAVAGAQVAAIYILQAGISTQYFIFYSQTANSQIQLWTAQVAASSIGKQVYIISFHGVPVPASVSN